MRVWNALMWLVFNVRVEPLESLGCNDDETNRNLESVAPRPFERELISETLGCGVRAIDGLLTCGRGQRMGIFGGSGGGKSTLIGMMARSTAADLTVLALIGERGREGREFLEHSFGEARRQPAGGGVSTSDQT